MGVGCRAVLEFPLVVGVPWDSRSAHCPGRGRPGRLFPVPHLRVELVVIAQLSGVLASSWLLFGTVVGLAGRSVSCPLVSGRLANGFPL